MSSHEILLVEEDARTREFLKSNLTADGFRVRVAEDRERALELLEAEEPALVVADINGQTLGLLDAVRSGSGLAGTLDPDLPMIVLTGHADRLERVRLLERGGDDVVSKPFSYVELRARIRSVLRRAERRQHPRVLRVGTLRVDLASREVHVNGRPVALAAKAFELLCALAVDPTRVRTRPELLREVWGHAVITPTRTVDTHALRLRRALEQAEPDRALVVTVWGRGYRLCNTPSQLGA